MGERQGGKALANQGDGGVGHLADMVKVAMFVSLVLLIVKSGMEGAFTAQTAGLILVALVVLAAIGSSQGWGLIKTVFRVAVPIASGLTFAIWNGSGDSHATAEILFGIGLVVVVMYAIYIIVVGGFRKRGKRRKRDAN